MAFAIALLTVTPATPALAAAPGDPTGTPGQVDTDDPVGGTRMGERGVVAPDDAPALPGEVGASGWLIADAETGAVLAAKDPHGKYLPASTLKTLTALTLLPQLPDRSQLVTATDEDANIDGTRVGLIPGGQYPVETLFSCMLMMSGNDCANSLARAAGGVPQTLTLMNAEARRLGAYDTHAATPSGLDGPDQSSSPYDLALILRQALDVPDFRRYNTTHTAVVPAQPNAGQIQFVNDNLLLKNYPATIAAKNGYTDAARQTFVAAAERDGHRLIVTLMHGERHPVEMWQQAADLLDWGFALPAGVEPVGQLAKPDETSGLSPSPTQPSVTTTSATLSDTRLGWWPMGLAGVAALGVFSGANLAWRRRRRSRSD